MEKQLVWCMECHDLMRQWNMRIYEEGDPVVQYMFSCVNPKCSKHRQIVDGGFNEKPNPSP